MTWETAFRHAIRNDGPMIFLFASGTPPFFMSTCSIAFHPACCFWDSPCLSCVSRGPLRLDAKIHALAPNRSRRYHWPPAGQGGCEGVTAGVDGRVAEGVIPVWTLISTYGFAWCAYTR